MVESISGTQMSPSKLRPGALAVGQALKFLWMVALSCSISLAAPARFNNAMTRGLPVLNEPFKAESRTLSLDEITQTSTNKTVLSLKPWPSKAYNIQLPASYYFTLTATPYSSPEGLPPPAISSVQAFISTFADDITAAYPPPALSPPGADLTHYDLDSYTEYYIAVASPRVIGRPAPSEIVVAALRRLAAEVRQHGPPASIKGIINKDSGRLRPVKFFDTLKLEITPLRRDELDRLKEGGEGESKSVA
ncbi:MAG: hypothetical protein LQ339_007078 [Xanthoria mediterranea]|nr:MAG: hypothetical protein LQ339_007078 [Xanthoria mediterranea]